CFAGWERNRRRAHNRGARGCRAHNCRSGRLRLARRLQVSRHLIDIIAGFREGRDSIVLIDVSLAGVVSCDGLRVVALVIAEEKPEIADAPEDVFRGIETVRYAETAR